MSTEKSQTRNQTLTFTVVAAAESPTEARVSVHDFESVVDEPELLGGANADPNPAKCVLGALAGCLNVTVHVVIREMGLGVRDLEIAIEGDLSPATFMGKREDGHAGYQEIRVTVTADIDADAETIDAWLIAVEARCPISDNLRNATPLALSFDRRWPPHSRRRRRRGNRPSTAPSSVRHGDGAKPPSPVAPP